jgi:hypothetical protein
MKKQDESIVAKTGTGRIDKDVEDILLAALAKNVKRKRLLKRVSPFLLLAVLLTLWFPYVLITGDGMIENRWVLFAVFVITLVNILFIDHALWKYFERKKAFTIWIIEIIFSLLIMYFLF